MHLKNFSLITQDGVNKLSPAYDLLNTTIVLQNAKEEIALPLNGKKNNLQQKDFDYFAQQRLQLNKKVISAIFAEIKMAVPYWRILIQNSFLSLAMKEKYVALLNGRIKRLSI